MGANSDFLELESKVQGEPPKNVIQKELNTKSDYIEMTGALKKAAALGNEDAKFYLGVVHYQGVPLKKGERIVKDKVKGEKLLYSGILDGSLKSLSFLVLNGIKNNDIAVLSKSIHTAQKSMNISNETKDYYSLLLAGHILDNYEELKNNPELIFYIEVATKWLYQAEKTRATDKIQYILANIYNALGNKDAANFYLNKSCQHDSMQKLCSQHQAGLTESSDSDSCKKI